VWVLYEDSRTHRLLLMGEGKLVLGIGDDNLNYPN